MYDMKALYEATSVSNAVELRLEHPEAQIIAGGSDVLVQYSSLENPMDRGAWQAIVHGVAKHWT